MAFATASRLRLLYALVSVERTVEELATTAGLSSTVVSQQLRVLRLLRLVQARRDGRHMRYRLFDDHVADLLAAIRHHGEHVESLTVQHQGANTDRTHVAARTGRRSNTG